MGMQFKFELIEKILAGQKTQTRRPAKFLDGHIEFTKEQRKQTLGVIFTQRGRVKWEVGRTYAIQPGRGKSGLGRIQIVCIRYESTQDISPSDAQAEGFASVAEFSAYWSRLYIGTKYAWENNVPVVVLEFELVKRESERWAELRFNTRVGSHIE
jgi:hypothetical protein